MSQRLATTAGVEGRRRRAGYRPIRGAITRSLAILVCLGAFLFPVYWVVTMAFKPEPEWESYGGNAFWVPQHSTLDNFRIVFGQLPSSQFAEVATEQSALPAIENSLVTAIGGTALAVLAGTLAAYGIARFRAGGRRFPYKVLLVRMFPPLVFVIPLFFMWYDLGLFDTRLGLMLAYGGLALPFVVWLPPAILGLAIRRHLLRGFTFGAISR